MAKGPKGEKRATDVVGCAIAVAKVATGEIDESKKKKSGRVRSGIAGAKSRSKALTPSKRSKIAKLAAEARWKKKD